APIPTSIPVLVPAPIEPILNYPLPTSTPASVAVPRAVTTGTDGDEKKKNVVAEARREIVRLMMVECAVPNKQDRKSMIACTVSLAIQSAAASEPPKGIEHEMREMMCEVQRVFKTYALYHLHKEFSLRLAQGQPQTLSAYRATRARELLRSYEFLRKQSSHPFFSSAFFEHFILDVLTLFPFQLGVLVTSTYLDNVFCLAGAAIIAALHDFDEGSYKPRSLDGETWQGYYKEIMLKVKEMQADLTTGLWLHDFQSRLLACA
ncbi:hypothetical protein J3R83DRAFT_10627, partial [Lanmaoa asiatica]